MFQIKDFLSIVASMTNHMRGTQTQITDFSVGGVARTLVEAPAVEIDELYQQMFHGLREAIPVATFNSFDFARLAEQGASGVVVFTVSPVMGEDLMIPAGTRVRQSGSSYEYATGSDVTILAGESTAYVTVHSTATGYGTNVAAGSITELAVPIPGVTVLNPAAFTNGRDTETDAERKNRFMDYITTISRGTGAAIRYGASTATVMDDDGIVVERVESVVVEEPYLTDPVTYPTALVWVYVHNGTGSTSAELVDAAQRIIDGYVEADGTLVPGYKAAGVIVEVSAAVDVAVGVTATISVSDAYSEADAIAEASAAVSGYLTGLNVGEPAILAEIIALLMGVDGVENCTVTEPVADVIPSSHEKLLAVDLAITAA